MIRKFFKLIFLKWYGWQIKGDMPNVKKYIIVVAPHTSNYDFLIGVAVRSILGFKASYLGKKELFKAPFGWLFRKLGGYPVDRSKHTNLVDAVAAIFDAHDEFAIAIAPEGTRKFVPTWKTGFYYMAIKAKVPLVLSAFNYKTKTVEILEPFYPTGNKVEDENTILNFYKEHQGRFIKKLPEKLFS